MEKNTNSLNQLESTLELYFVKKAPAMPDNIKELIVSFAPWLTLIGAVLGLAAIPLLLAAVGISAFVMPFAMASGVYTSPLWIVSAAVAVGAMVLQFMAIPGLFKRKASAWKLIYYAMLISLLSQLIGLNIVSFVISALVGFWVLFQVKPLYK